MRPTQWGRARLTPRTAPYVLVAPVVLLFAIFTVYPVLDALYLSFLEVRGIRAHFVGLSNYARLLSDPVFWKALSNTFFILLVQVPLMLTLALGIAVALNRGGMWGRSTLRAVYFLPAVTSLVVAAIVFSLFWNREYGMVNWLLSSLGIQPINWLGDPFWAPIAVSLTITWRWTGYNMVILLAGLQQIPTELYEAAALDGAGKWQLFRRVTLPMLSPVLLFTAVLSTIGTLQLFTEPYILTQGGPLRSTLTIGYYLYNTAFRFTDFGYAAAISYMMVLLIGGFSFFQFRLVRRRWEA